MTAITARRITAPVIPPAIGPTDFILTPAGIVVLSVSIDYSVILVPDCYIIVIKLT